MTTPTMNWDDQEAFKDDTVWWTRFDKRFQIEVVRVDPDKERTAELRIFDHNDNDKLLLSERVGLSYAALFGPDMDDVASWQDRVVKFVDEELAS